MQKAGIEAPNIALRTQKASRLPLFYRSGRREADCFAGIKSFFSF
jgi:hypothetical protein